MNKKTKTIRFISIIICLSFLLKGSFVFAEDSDLQKQIDDKKQTIDEINKKISVYQDNIRKKQSEAATLKNQMAILENDIAKTTLDIQATGTEISKTQLETRNIELQILGKEDSLTKQHYLLETIVQEINKDDQKNELHILLLNNSISDFYSQMEYTKNLEDKLQGSLDNLKLQKQALSDNKTELEQKQATLLKLKDDLNAQNEGLNGQHVYKDKLLDETHNSEKKFTELYMKAKNEQQAISSEITALEKKIRGQMNSGEKKSLTFSSLIWPVPKGRITATFHDPDYPFRYLFEHPAIDIRTPQSTAIHAPADGYVLTAKDGGMGYSYVAIIHGNGLSTVYGHVSRIYVREGDFVSEGDIIALSGAMPGTPGAGRLTTGPHLHFEVRLNGIPVNPLDYLP